MDNKFDKLQKQWPNMFKLVGVSILRYVDCKGEWQYFCEINELVEDNIGMVWR